MKGPALALTLLLVPGPAAAQEPHGFEAGAMGVLALGRRDFAGGGLGGAWRPGGGVRLALALLAGERGGAAARGEVVGHLLLEPAKVRGVGVYALGGIAATGRRRLRGDLLLGLGAETSPAGRWGLALEGGIGGGVRIAVTLKRRWLHRPARAG